MAEPRHVSFALRELLDKLAGCDTVAQIRANKCVPPPIGCGGDAVEFRDTLSVKEYGMSGLCQTCQDKVFQDDDKWKTRRSGR